MLRMAFIMPARTSAEGTITPIPTATLASVVMTSGIGVAARRVMETGMLASRSNAQLKQSSLRGTWTNVRHSLRVRGPV